MSFHASQETLARLQACAEAHDYAKSQLARATSPAKLALCEKRFKTAKFRWERALRLLQKELRRKPVEVQPASGPGQS